MYIFSCIYFSFNIYLDIWWWKNTFYPQKVPRTLRVPHYYYYYYYFSFVYNFPFSNTILNHHKHPTIIHFTFTSNRSPFLYYPLSIKICEKNHIPKSFFKNLTWHICRQNDNQQYVLYSHISLLNIPTFTKCCHAQATVLLTYWILTELYKFHPTFAPYLRLHKPYFYQFIYLLTNFLIWPL